MFRTLTEYRRTGPNPVEEILKILKKLKDNDFVDPVLLRRTIQKYYNDTLRPDIPESDEVDSIVNRKLPITEEVSEVLQKLGNFHVLDISREISLLREIKDIQDELSIMAMVFEDQISVLKEMERKIRSIEKPTIDLSKFMPNDSSRSVQKGICGVNSNGINNHVDDRTETRNRESNRPDMQNLKSGNQAKSDPGTESESEDGEDQDILSEKSVIADKDQDETLRDQFVKYSQYLNESQFKSVIWGSSTDSKHSSLPLTTVQLSIDEVKWMSQRAAKANQAVSFRSFLPISQPFTRHIFSTMRSV
jgi:hypothetical protein